MPSHQRPFRSVFLACAIGVPAAVVLAGCGGDDLSSNAVASIDGNEITKTEFASSEKLNLLAVSQQLTGNGVFKSNPPKLVNLSAPYTECVTLTKKTLPEEQAAQTPASAITDYCKELPANAKSQAVQGLLVQVIAEAEAKKYKVTVPAAEVDKQVEALYTQLLGGKQNLAKFTALTGANAETLRNESLSQLRLQKVQEKIQKDNSTVTDADLQAYYNKNKKTYQVPETRNLHIVLAKNEADAKKARAELDDGAKFATVAKKYSTDEVTKDAGGKLENVQKGQQEKALENAAFSTAASELAGPVKTESGWYVVRVDKITPASTTPFAEAKASIKPIVQQTKPSEAVEKWTTGVVDEWKKKTECREGYNQSVFCPNMPEPATTTAPGAAPAQ